MHDLITKDTTDYHYHYYYSNKSEKISSSIEPKSYNDAREEYQRTMRL
jgi:hypothetical protein